MLKYLAVNNIAVMRECRLELGSGLVAFTGETGAGKSILVDALGLLLGSRASAELIRTGEDRASAEAMFEVPGIAQLLEARGLPSEGDDVVLRREITASGRGRASVNGALVPVATLRDLAPRLATIVGQHEGHGLLDATTHVRVLDRFAGLESLVASLAEPLAEVRRVDHEIDAFARDRRETERRREMLEYQLAEITRAGLRTGEEEELRAEKSLQQNAERLTTAATEAFELLHEDEAAVLPRLERAYRRVDDIARIDPRFAVHLEARASVRATLQDLATALRQFSETVQVVPGRLDDIEERLAALERLKRKYGATTGEILAFAERCQAELDTLRSPEAHLAELREARAAAAVRYMKAAAALSRQRRDAAQRLAGDVEAELGELALPMARFEVSFEPREPDAAHGEHWTVNGLEQVEFLLSTNPGEAVRPLNRVASGGELARILLALQGASKSGEQSALVFDEVDSGIGGAVAEVVGRKLRRLSAGRQVFCVTHLAQVAALAQQHLTVRKETDGLRTWAAVEDVSGQARVEEIARMIGGEVVSDTARKHAREMVKQASARV